MSEIQNKIVNSKPEENIIFIIIMRIKS